MLQDRVARFLRLHPRGPVGIEGVEVLLMQNDFPTLMKTIHMVRDHQARSEDAVVLFRLQPSALPEDQWTMLERRAHDPLGLVAALCSTGAPAVLPLAHDLGSGIDWWPVRTGDACLGPSRDPCCWRQSTPPSMVRPHGTCPAAARGRPRQSSPPVQVPAE